MHVSTSTLKVNVGYDYAYSAIELGCTYRVGSAGIEDFPLDKFDILLTDRLFSTMFQCYGKSSLELLRRGTKAKPHLLDKFSWRFGGGYGYILKQDDYFVIADIERFYKRYPYSPLPPEGVEAIKKLAQQINK